MFFWLEDVNGIRLSPYFTTARAAYDFRDEQFPFDAVSIVVGA